MSAETKPRSHTTLWVRKDTASRLKKMKPYDSISMDEWLGELADTYENVE